MGTLLLLAQLAAFVLPVTMPPLPPPPPVLFQQTVQADQETDGPNPTPLPGHGPYEHARGWFCTKAPTNEAVKNVQCACQETCENGGSEDRSCQTSCANPKKCRCHEDDSKCAPEVIPAPKKKRR